jgi:hypothetical protein
MHYSGLLHNAEWYLHADVSGYPIGSMLKGQVNQGLLILDDVTDTFPETSVRNYHSTLGDTQKRANLIYIAAEA